MFLPAISHAAPTELEICLVVPFSINVSPLAGLESLKFQHCNLTLSHYNRGSIVAQLSKLVITGISRSDQDRILGYG